IFKHNAALIGKIARYTPVYFFLMLAEGVIWGFIHSAESVFNYNLLNTVDGGEFHYAVKIIAVMASFWIIAYIFDKWYWCIMNPLIKRKLHLRMHEEMFVKARSLDLSCFDDPEFYNDFVWAMNESDQRAINVMEDTGKLINRIVASATLFTLLFTVDPIIALILFLSSAVTVISNLIANKVSFMHSKETNPLWRKKDYINRVYHLSDYAKELRIRRADELLMADYDENTEKIIAAEKKYGKKYFLLYGLGWNAVGTVTNYAVILYMIVMLSRGELAVGGFAASVGMIWRIRWLLVDLIDRITKYPKHSLYIEKYLEFMRFEPQIKDGITDIPDFESLEFRDVSFSYEFSAHPKYAFHDEDYTPPEKKNGKEALKHVSIKLFKGDKIAIVGYNGAGKTTLIKLIMRLYDPTEGEILYNGINIKEFDPEAYRKKIGTVFQDFKIFAASIAENVMNGEYCDKDEKTVKNALQKADFTGKLESLGEGIYTHLTREFNDKGTNLSGGEAQKIAISRVFAKEYPIVIMDEPSSALDPMAEYNLNQSILHNTEGKTVIFISHRLSTTRIADKIYMFDSGNLIEEGSHTELLNMNGKYAEMFRVQSEKYQIGEA
ncbi:MAG: ABC transporter ATP-binding protein, partial [Clostridia bacterium]|nr:ABC transporter ATP-binding protein [Clostridia bacterium]